MTFRYLPPAPEEARAFAYQFAGTLAGVLLLGLAWARIEGVRPMLLGTLLGLLYLLGRSAWALELKARRSQVAEIEVGEEGVRFREEKGETLWPWPEIEECEVRGGRLVLRSRRGEKMEERSLSARELEEGMQLMGEVAARWKNSRGEGPRGFVPPTNFIPLSPK
jgi:hypothetical protein